jgi:YidC/Oxa1 family membrane protein insertase
MAAEKEPNIEIRALIALVISLAILAGWQYFFAPSAPPPAPATVEESQAGEISGEAESLAPIPEAAPLENEAAAATQAEPEPVEGAIFAEAEEEVVVDTGLLRTTLTNRGARISSLILNDFQGDFGGPLELIVDVFAEQNALPLDLITPMSPELAAEANDALYVMTIEGGISRGGVRASQSEPIVVRWRWSDGAGWLVEKSLTFPRDSYLLELRTRIRTPRDTPVFIGLGPSLQDRVDSSTRSFYLTSGSVALLDGGVEHWAFDDLEAPIDINGQVGWGGVESDYFTTLFVPPDGGGRLHLDALPWPALVPAAEGESDAADEERGAGVRTGLYVPTEGLEVPFYVGPKQHSLLASYGHNLDRAVDFGFFSFLALPLLISMNWVYGYVGNYGLAIILLTVVLKILFLPLTHRSMKSMRKMQKLQPEMAAIRARYKGVKDMEKRQDMNTEIMGLYKTHGVSPLGGCLPLLLQMPFLFAFYSALSVAIEIRHAPFMLWIMDLSKADPYLVLPLLMGVSMYAQQRMTPTTADPVQARIFRFMPVMFTFIFLSLPSGLVLYWFVNNLLGIAQQVVINRQVEAEATTAEATKGSKKGKPKGKGEKAAPRSQSKRGKK